MPERLRAYQGDKTVTILKGRIGGRGKTTIRNSFGFEEVVPSNTLRPIPEGEPGRVLRYSKDNEKN